MRSTGIEVSPLGKERGGEGVLCHPWERCGQAARHSVLIQDLELETLVRVKSQDPEREEWCQLLGIPPLEELQAT